jgi:hypothetical protein
MINIESLDKRICDVEQTSSNTQTYRDFIRESEKMFGIEPAPIDRMDNDELKEYFDFLDYLWEK